MKINLNNTLIIGTKSEDPGADGYYKFYRWAVSNSRDFFIQFCQYIIDSCPDVSDFVIIDSDSQMVFRFDGFVFDTLGMKSKRYPR